jgi:integrase
MSSIYTRDGSVWISFTDKRGRRIRKATGFKLKSIRKDQAGNIIYPNTVLDLQKRLDANLTLGRWDFIENKKQSPLFSTVVAEFTVHHQQDRSKGTLAGYKLCTNEFINTCGDEPIGNYDEQDLLKFRVQQLAKYSDFSAARVITVLRTVFNWALASDYIQRNPVTKRVLVHPRTKAIVTYTNKELKSLFELLDADNPELARQLRFLHLSGFRSGESCALKWSQIDFDDAVIKHWNQKETRWEAYPVDEQLINLLRMAAHRYEPFVFKYRHVSTISHYLHLACETLGIENRNVHTLKKTYVKNLIRAGLSEAETHRLSHHKSFETTLKYYAEFDIGKLRKALARSRRPIKDVTFLSHKKRGKR